MSGCWICIKAPFCSPCVGECSKGEPGGGDQDTNESVLTPSGTSTPLLDSSCQISFCKCLHQAVQQWVGCQGDFESCIYSYLMPFLPWWEPRGCTDSCAMPWLLRMFLERCCGSGSVRGQPHICHSGPWSPILAADPGGLAAASCSRHFE